jgi:hypothetical protein
VTGRDPEREVPAGFGVQQRRMAERADFMRHGVERGREHVGIRALPQQAGRPAACHDDVIRSVRAAPGDVAALARLARREATMQREIGDDRRVPACGCVEIVRPRPLRPTVEVGAERHDP